MRDVNKLILSLFITAMVSILIAFITNNVFIANIVAGFLMGVGILSVIVIPIAENFFRGLKNEVLK